MTCYNAKMIGIIFNLIAGIFVGMANVIPGVSGGTIAVIFGVYPRLLKVSSVNFTAIKKDAKNITALLFGMVLGILIFAKIINFLFMHYPTYISFFFVGIILGSVPFLFRLIKTDQKEASSNLVKAIAFLFGFIIIVTIFIIQKQIGNIENSVVSNTSFKIMLWLFGLGIVSAIAMIVPGISGAFLLLILGGYQTILSAIDSLNIVMLLPFAVGVGLGLIVASRLFSTLIKRFPQIIYSFIFGLVLPSILFILPIQKQFAVGYIISLLSCVFGIAVVFLFTYLGNKKLGGMNE